MRAVIGSVALHAVLAWLVFHGDREGAPRSSAAASPSITVVDAVEVDLLPPTPRADAIKSGGARSRSVQTRSRVASTDPRGEIRIDRGDASGGEQGAGGLGGAGGGTGIGFGDGGTIQRPELLAPPPAPKGAPPSKARPARLIYPTRQRDVDDAELFIARVTIDDEGFIAGARLVRGFGGRRDEVASDMIWKFRYAPALDAAGHPIQSTLDQRFLVGP